MDFETEALPEEDEVEREVQIRDVAYQLWQDEGRPEGRELDHWGRAQDIIGQGQKAPADTTIKRPSRARPAAKGSTAGKKRSAG